MAINKNGLYSLRPDSIGDETYLRDYTDDDFSVSSNLKDIAAREAHIQRQVAGGRTPKPIQLQRLAELRANVARRTKGQ